MEFDSIVSGILVSDSEYIEDIDYLSSYLEVLLNNYSFIVIEFVIYILSILTSIISELCISVFIR